MQLVIAEKPSVAADIAKVIGARENKKEYFEGGGWIVTWLYGHLLELDAPEAAGNWALETLPILPAKFTLKPVPGRSATDNSIVRRIKTVGELMGRCSGIVVATDAGREGELIFRRIYRHLKCTLPFTRLWVNSMTEAAIKDGFAHLRPGHDYDNLGKAAELRAIADWIVGINATRALTLASGYNQYVKGKVLSLGRVQTPTLCMICERYLEHINFKSETFWFIEGEGSHCGVSFKFRSADRYHTREAGEADYERVTRAGRLTVTSVLTKRVNEEPPLLHDIASLQKMANSIYGYTAEQTLSCAQSLYEKKYLTYPRTDSRYIPEDVFATVPGILRSIEGDALYGEFARAILDGGPSRRSVDATGDKITDHHALILTENIPSGLTEEENNVYNLVVIRFLEAFSGTNVADLTTVEFDAGGVTLIAKGRKDVVLGWRVVRKAGQDAPVDLDEADEIEASIRPLPEMQYGQGVAIARSGLVEDQTKPKPLLSDATLLTAMEGAGKGVDDKRAAETLREVGGIGTKATRSEIIETLVTRRYVERKKKRLVPTDLGMEVYEAIHDGDIANVELTARWEMSLEQVARNGGSSGTFLDGIKAFTTRVTREIIRSEGVAGIKRKLEEIIPDCPACGKKLRLLEKSAWCSECNWTLWRKVSGKDLTDDHIRELLKNGKTGLLSGFRSKDGKEFSAVIELNADGSTRLNFSKREFDVKCPLCGKPMKAGKKGAWCECGLNVWRSAGGKELSDAVLQKLLTKGRSGIMSFTSKNGREYKADLELQRDGSLRFIYQDNK